MTASAIGRPEAEVSRDLSDIGSLPVRNDCSALVRARRRLLLQRDKAAVVAVSRLCDPGPADLTLPLLTASLTAGHVVQDRCLCALPEVIREPAALVCTERWIACHPPERLVGQ